jgi:hypothetical protein
MKWPAILSASLAAYALASAGPAYATTFDAAHEPPEITNPGVQATEGGFPESFTVTLSFTLTCPGLVESGGPPGDSVPYTVAFSTPYGTTSLALADGCQGTWQENHAVGVVGDELNPKGGVLQTGFPELGQPAVEVLKPTLSYKPSQAGPFLWQVIAPTGSVVAQGPEYAKVKTPGPREISERSNLDAFINECIDGNHEVLSKEHGDLYCVIEEPAMASYRPHHWPAPPQPITASTAPKWIRAAVVRFLHSSPKHFSATGCKQRSLGRFRCLVAWRAGSRKYSGSVEVGNLNSATGAFRYALRVIETNHGRRRTVRTAY